MSWTLEDLWHAETETETSTPEELASCKLWTMGCGLRTADYGQSCKYLEIDDKNLHLVVNPTGLGPATGVYDTPWGRRSQEIVARISHTA